VAAAADRQAFRPASSASCVTPDLLLAGEQAVLARTPAPDDELLAAQLDRLQRRLDAADTERRRLADR
jgi:hypothetical protein